jgi:hypothetical protein
MIPAKSGVHVQESDLEGRVTLDPKGIFPDDLVRLAGEFNLTAEMQDTTAEELRDILAAGKLPTFPYE